MFGEALGTGASLAPAPYRRVFGETRDTGTGFAAPAPPYSRVFGETLGTVVGFETTGAGGRPGLTRVLDFSRRCRGTYVPLLRVYELDRS